MSKCCYAGKRVLSGGAATSEAPPPCQQTNDVTFSGMLHLHTTNTIKPDSSTYLNKFAFIF